MVLCNDSLRSDSVEEGKFFVEEGIVPFLESSFLEMLIVLWTKSSSLLYRVSRLL